MRILKGDFAALAISAEEMREMDRRTIEEYGLPAAVLMENAGGCVTQVACEMAPPGARAVVTAGAGNNAGDGFVVARQLANRGFSVIVILAVAPAKYSGHAGANFRVIRKMGIETAEWSGEAAEEFRRAGLILDALLGTGLSGPLRAPYGDIIERVNAAGAPVVSVDVPSGLDGDTGEIATAAVRADKTVTFALPKTGLYRGQGPSFTGEVILGDIEMPRAVYPAGKAPA